MTTKNEQYTQYINKVLETSEKLRDFVGKTADKISFFTNDAAELVGEHADTAADGILSFILQVEEKLKANLAEKAGTEADDRLNEFRKTKDYFDYLSQKPRPF